MTKPKVAVIVVSWNHGRYLADCFRAYEKSGADPATSRLMIVDNASTDGTKQVIRGLLSEDGTRTSGGAPAVYFDNVDNLGFSGGNNQATRLALEDGDDYVYLLNPDTEAQPGFLEEALKVAEADPKIGIVQSLLRLHPRTELVNSYGNEIHYLGFGYAGGESRPLGAPDVEEKLKVREIAYASGAGMLMRASMLKSIGMLDEELFAYHEDLELSWRARLAGWKVMLAPTSVVFHKYEFSRSIKKYFWMERNRLLVMLRCYRLATLALLLPAFLAMEIGLWIFAFRSGWWREKLRTYAHFLSFKNWSALAAARRRVQALRVVSDRAATATFTGRILFQQMQPRLLTKVANPLFAAYWTIVRLILRW